KSLQLHPDDTAWFAARCRAVLETGTQLTAIPVRMLTEDGVATWFLATGSARADAEGEPSVGGYVIEVPYARLSVENLYAAVLDSLVEKVAITDRRGDIVETNRAWEASEAGSLVPGRRVSL